MGLFVCLSVWKVLLLLLLLLLQRHLLRIRFLTSPHPPTLPIVVERLRGVCHPSAGATVRLPEPRGLSQLLLLQNNAQEEEERGTQRLQGADQLLSVERGAAALLPVEHRRDSPRQEDPPLNERFPFGGFPVVCGVLLLRTLSCARSLLLVGALCAVLYFMFGEEKGKRSGREKREERGCSRLPLMVTVRYFYVIMLMWQCLVVIFFV